MLETTEMTNKRKNCKRREMVMSIMIYDEMKDQVDRTGRKTTTTTNGDGKLPEAEEIELSQKNYCISKFCSILFYP